MLENSMPGDAQETSTLLPEQEHAAQALSYLKLLTLFETTADNYATWRKNAKGDMDERKDIKARGALALEDLYFSKGDPEKTRAFQRDWGEEADVFSNLLTQPDFVEREKNIESESREKAKSFSTMDRLKMTYDCAKKLSSDISPEQKERLLSLVGYSKEERAEIAKKIALSGAITAGTTAVFIAAETTALSQGGSIPFIDSLSEKDAQLALGVSYLFNAASIAANSIQNVRMLKDKSVENSPNALATSMYYLIRKILPKNERVQDAATFAIPLVPLAINEPAVVTVGLIAAPSFFLPGLIAKNLAGMMMNVAETGLAELWLRKARKTEKESVETNAS